MKKNKKKINNLYYAINYENSSYNDKIFLNKLFIKFKSNKIKKVNRNIMSKIFKYLRILNLK